MIYWLGFMCLLVVAMIVVGGATRLTNSGLSITEWKPITGALPPLSHDAWLSEFEKYKQIPEFAIENPDMTLREFEFIYFWEWSHRQLGRFIGLVYAIPFFVMLFRKTLPQGRKGRFWAVLILIGVQGAIGWWMVSSGLQGDNVDVEAYRLATHLSAAFIILGLLVWMFMDALGGWVKHSAGPVTKLGMALLATIWLQIVAGAFVAGTHAGDTFKEWPMMDGDFFPRGYGHLSPAWTNWFENVIAIQFNHRVLAYLVLALSIIFAISAFKKARRQTALWGAALLTLVVWQVVVGIMTLLSMDPHGLALKHQFTAAILFVVAVITVWQSRIKAHPLAR